MLALPKTILYYYFVFERCNLRCRHCWYKDGIGYNSSINDVNVTEDLDAFIESVSHISKELPHVKTITLNVGGGELFMDGIKDSDFIKYESFINKARSLLQSLYGLELDVEFVTNGVFTKRERVLNLLKNTKSTISFSYDPIYRFNSDTQKKTMIDSVDYFTSHKAINLAGSSVDYCIYKDTVDYLLSNPEELSIFADNKSQWLYYKPNKETQDLAPTQEQLFDLFLYVLDNRLYNQLLPWEVVKSIINSKNNSKYEVNRYCDNCNMFILHHGIITRCCAQMSMNDYNVSCGMKEDPDIRSVIKFINAKDNYGQSHTGCLNCPKREICGRFCWASQGYKPSTIYNECFMYKLYDHIDSNPDIIEDYIKYTRMSDSENNIIMSDCSIFDWWEQYINIKPEDRAIMKNIPTLDDWINDDFDLAQYKIESQELFEKLKNRGNHNITTSEYSLHMDKCLHIAAEKIIRYFNDNRNSIFVITDKEHCTIMPVFESIKNQGASVITIPIKDTTNPNEILKRFKDVKPNKTKFNGDPRIVSYTIGLTNNGSDETCETFVNAMRKFANSRGLEYIAILDDVQGEFVLPKTYSLYDMILGTSHSLLYGFDAGLIICKKSLYDSNMGLCQNFKILKKLNKALDVVLDKFPRLLYMDYVLKKFFRDNNIIEDIKFESISPVRTLITLPIEILNEKLPNRLYHDDIDPWALYSDPSKIDTEPEKIILETNRERAVIHARAHSFIDDMDWFKFFFNYIIRAINEQRHI